jgi:hypothetical protein
MGPEQLSQYSNGLRGRRPVLDSRNGQEIFLYSTASRSTLMLTQQPIQRETKAVSTGVRRSGCEVGRSPL